MIQRRLLFGLGFFIVPAVIYLGLVTRWSFDLFGSAYGWQAYNYYALALAEGRQSVPAEVIAGEGLYIGGHVYMYYGILPALVRLPLMPFVDLRHVPVSNLVTSVMLIAGQWAMQLAILKVFVANGRMTVWADRFVLVLVSFAAWFMSGPFLLAQNGNFYHEPYAAALMLTSIYIAMLANDLLVAKRRPSTGRLLVYALLAGLSVYTRQTTAVGLYAVTLALLLPDWTALRSQSGALGAAVRRAVLPLLLLFLFGAAYLALAYLRLGKLGTGWTVEDYGYYILGNDRPRLHTLMVQQFSAVRIIPNTIFYLFGGHALREDLICQWGGGLVVTFGKSVRWAIFAAVPLAMALAGAVCVVRRLLAREPLSVLVALSALGLLLMTLLNFSYATSQYRYYSETWAVIGWLVLVAMRDIDPKRLFGKWLVPAMAVAVGLAAVSLVYSATLRPSLANDAPGDRGSVRINAPLAPELAARATAAGARDPDVIAIRNATGSDPDLPPGWRPKSEFSIPERRCQR